MGDDDMTRLLEAVEDQLGGSWVHTVEWLRATNQIDDIASRVRVGDFDGAVAGVEAAANRVGAAIQRAYVTSGEAAVAFVDDIKPGKLITFNQQNPRAAAWAEANRLELARELTTETRRVVSQVVARGVQNGTNPRDVARDIRDSIGLTQSQEQHVANFRRALEDGDWSKALGYELRDKRADRSLAKLKASGGTLSPDRIDSMVERYHANYVSHRAEVIARTEGLRALHEGVNEGFEQAIENGDIARDELVQEWHSAGDPRVRDSHSHVVDAETGRRQKPIGIGYWRTQDGNTLQYPGDPSAPASEVINCRCVVSTVVDLNVQPTTTAPPNFDAGNAQVREGVPDRDNIRDNALYRVPIDDLRGKLWALPGVSEDPQRQRNVDNHFAGGKFGPVKLHIDERGRFFIEDGRHRLTNALANDRDVLVRFGTMSDATAGGAVPLQLPPTQTSSATDLPTAPRKNPKRVAAAKKAAEAGALRRREIYSTVVSNLPDDLQAAWAKDGHKFMRAEADRIRGIKDPVNAGSKISEAFAETYGSGEASPFGNEGDRYSRRAEIDAAYGESWADDQTSKYYERMRREALDAGHIDDYGDYVSTPSMRTTSDEDVPF